MTCYVAKLPNEVLERILLPLADIDGENFMWSALNRPRLTSTEPETTAEISVLMKVCRKWHHLIQMNPQFRSMRLVLRGQTHPSNTQDLLKKSNGCNLDVHIRYLYDIQEFAVDNLYSLGAYGHQIRRLIFETQSHVMLTSLIPILNNFRWRRLEDILVFSPYPIHKTAISLEKLNLSSANRIQSLSFSNINTILSMKLPEQMPQLQRLQVTQTAAGGRTEWIRWPPILNILRSGSRIRHITLFATLTVDHPVAPSEVMVLPCLKSLKIKDPTSLCTLQQYFRLDALENLELGVTELEVSKNQGEYRGLVSFQTLVNLKRHLLKIDRWDRSVEQLLSEALPSEVDTLLLHLCIMCPQPELAHSRSAAIDLTHRFSHIHTLVVYCEGPQPYLGYILSHLGARSTIQRLVVESSLRTPAPLFFSRGRSTLSNYSNLLPGLLHLDCQKLMPQDIGALAESLDKSRLTTLTQYSDFTQWASIVVPFPVEDVSLEGLSSLLTAKNLTTIAIAIDPTRLGATQNPLHLFPNVENLSLSISYRKETRQSGTVPSDSHLQNAVNEDLCAIINLFASEGGEIPVPKLRSLHLVLEDGYHHVWETVTRNTAQWRATNGVPLDLRIVRLHREWPAETSTPGRSPVIYEYDWDLVDHVPWKLRSGDQDHLDHSWTH
jgi:hypothetical protein